MKTWASQLKKGVVEFAVLAALAQGEAYGYELLRRLEDSAGLAMSESTVYPLLARLTRDGLLRVRSVASPNGPARRYYELTAAGQRRLMQMTQHWREVTAGLDQLLEGK